MLKKTLPCRYDIVGSFLRSNAIKDARRACDEGRISSDELAAIEDEEIRILVEKQKEAGLLAVTDGEYRRSFWHLDFIWGLQGIAREKAARYSIAFSAHQPKSLTLRIAGKLDFPAGHPFISHFKSLRKAAGEATPKLCIPSPSMIHLIACVRTADYAPIPRYEDESILWDDIVETYRKAVRAFYDAGCRYLQFDDTSWGEFCSAEKRAEYAARGINVDETARSYVKAINRIMEARPDDMTITMHICRGNFRSTWFTSGGYEPVAEILFGGCGIDAFFLEYDSDRAGGFEPLRFIGRQKVVLGLVTSKSPELEDAEKVVERIREASKFVPLDQLCVSTQCGFASTEEGNILTEKDQWAKIRLVRDVAARVWG